jgi:TorA maturation chaperone TorD
MAKINISAGTPLFLRFYARCFTYPYEEMGYELQHLFRLLENGQTNDDEDNHLEQILSILNSYQGEEIKILRDHYVFLFSLLEGSAPPCSLIISDFMRATGKSYDADTFIHDILESGIPVNPEEPIDTVINYLEYFSLLCESEAEAPESLDLLDIKQKHFDSWIPLYSDLLFKASQISFYKEVADGLQGYFELLGE